MMERKNQTMRDPKISVILVFSVPRWFLKADLPLEFRISG